MSIMDWLHSKGCREGKESWRYKLRKETRGVPDVLQTPPHFGKSEEVTWKRIMSNITHKDVVLSEDNLRNCFQKRFTYEYLLTFKDQYLRELTDMRDPKLDRDVETFFTTYLYRKNGLQWYFVKEYAPKSHRPHFHGFISFPQAGYSYMERCRKNFNNNYYFAFGHSQWCRINSWTESYKPTEQNLWQRRNIADVSKYYTYIHKDIGQEDSLIGTTLTNEDIQT